jgi:hypothetical protein
MPKKKSRPPKQKVEEQKFNLQQTITQSVTQSVVAWDDVAFSKLLETQAASLDELTSIKTLLELSKVKASEERSSGISSDTIQEKVLHELKEQTKYSRRYIKTQEEFQVEWDKEAKNIAEMAKGMKAFKTIGEKFKEKTEGVKEKYGSVGGLKKTILGAMNVGGVFNKTLERDEFVNKQKALGSTASTKELKADYEGARKATNAIKKNEKAIEAHKKAAGTEDEEHLKDMSPAFAALLAKRQSGTDELGKYDRSTRQFSPDKKNAMMAGLLPKSSTATAAEEMQNAETTEEANRAEEKQTDLLKKIEENTRKPLTSKDGKPAAVAPAAAPEGGGLLDSIFGMLSVGLMTAFKTLLNPMNILKALGKVFAIGIIVGALFEGIMDGFEEFKKTGDIGKALIAGLAGIIDFLTFGLFDKEKIKEVIGDFASWTSDHIIKPFTEFITAMKDNFMALIENIGLPAVKFTIPVVNKEVAIGPFYPFKSDAKPKTAPEATSPTAANIVEQKSADNAAAAGKPSESNKTNIVSAPVTTNNTTTQVIKSPIRNQESTQNRYIQSKYA